ncbi:hypothetical protein Hte_005053 [Hypoxylon texense]
MNAARNSNQLKTSLWKRLRGRKPDEEANEQSSNDCSPAASQSSLGSLVGSWRSSRPKEKVANSAPPLQPDSRDGKTSLGNHHHQADPAIKLLPLELDVSRGLWNEAYDKLRQEQEELIDEYERILNSQVVESALAEATTSFVGYNPQVRFGRMEAITKRSLEKAERHAKAEKETIATVNIIRGMAGFIKEFVAAYPPAAMGMSGISVVLLVLVKPLQSNQDMMEGLAYIMEMLEWCMALCRLLLRERQSSDSEYLQAKEVMRKRVVSLYVSVLGYQMKCVCHCCGGHQIADGIRSMLGRLNWKSELDLIKTREDGVRSDARWYNQQVAMDFMQSIQLSSQELPQISNLLKRLESHTQDANHDRMIKEKEKRQRYQSELTGRFNTTSYSSYMNANNLHVKDTCQWFCTHARFQKWLTSETDRILLVSADPGCGKSVLAYHLINSAVPARRPEATICYFFFKDNSEQRDLSNAYSAILHRLFMGNGKLANRCESAIERAGSSLTKRPAFLWSLFTAAVKNPDAGPVICILDALDECDPRGLQILIDDLKSLYTSSQDDKNVLDVRFLLTTRGHPRIMDQFRSLPQLYVWPVGQDMKESSAIQREINLVIDYRLRRLATLKGVDKKQEDKLRYMLHRRGGDQRTYIWVRLIFEVLEAAYPSNNDEWDDLIENLPSSVPAAYLKLLEKVHRNQQKRVLILLNLILAAYRPLSLQEMNIAINVRDRQGAYSTDDLNMVSDEAFRNWMLDACGFFVTVYDNKVFLIHQTAKEFLLGAFEESQEIAYSRNSVMFAKMDLESAHAVMAESCISYLSLKSCREGVIYDAFSAFARQIKGNETDMLSPEWKEINSYPFAKYVLSFWLGHFRHGQKMSSGQLLTDIDDDFRLYYELIFRDSAGQLGPIILASLRAQRIETLTRKSYQIPHYLAPYEYTLLSFLDKLGLREKFRDTQSDDSGFRVAALASLCGHLRILKEETTLSIPPREVSLAGGPEQSPGGPDPPIDSRLLDPICIKCAVIGETIPCLEYLITKGLPLNCLEPNGQTPLHWAAKNGSNEMVECLIRNGAGIEIADTDGHTPLTLALSYSDHHGDLQSLERVLRLLVRGYGSQRANTKATNGDGSTLLHFVAALDWGTLHEQSRGPGVKKTKSYEFPDEALKESIISFFVNHGAEVNTRDKKGQTPLLVACRGGFTYNIACLLYNKADPNICDGKGMPPLIAAIPNPSLPIRYYPPLQIFTLLLKHGADPNWKDEDTKNTALHAVCNIWVGDQVRIVAALVRCKADIHSKNIEGVSPIQMVAQQVRQPAREMVMVELLKNEANPNEVSELGGPFKVNGEQPISTAFGFKKPEDEALAGLGLTVLHRICLDRDPFLIRQLLKYDADPLARDSNGNTPLHLVVIDPMVDWGDEPWIEKAVRLLLGAAGELAETRNSAGRTPVDYVRENGWDWLMEAMPEVFGLASTQ